MNPKTDVVLGVLSGHLFTEILPLIAGGYAQGDTMMTALLLAGAAEEYDRAAEVRSADVAEMRELFAQAAERLAPGALGDRVAAAAGREPASLRIADLDACRDQLAGVLIALHEAVELSPEPWARELEAKIWQHLRASTHRRAMTTNPF